MRKVLCTIFIVIAVLTGSVVLVGCNAVEKVSDLVAIKINNFMAEWENPAYNFTYEGSNELTVNVPYTNVLKVTDLLLSPGSEATIYEDSGYKTAVANKENIAVDGSKKLYIQVKRATNKLKNTGYVVTVNVDAPVIPRGYAKEDIPLNNPDGHLWIPPEVKTVTINRIQYIVARNAQDLRDLAVTNKINNCIMACDIGDTKDIVIEENTHIFDGNNYAITSKNTVATYIFKKNSGTIKNLIMDTINPQDSENEGVPLVEYNSKKIENCVNRNNIKNMGQYKINYIYAFGQQLWKELTKSEINFCINYGNLLNTVHGRISGIGDATKVKYDYNVGDLLGRSGGSGSATLFGVSSLSKVADNCANLGTIVNSSTTAGVVCLQFSIDKSREGLYLANYGDITAPKDSPSVISTITNDDRSPLNISYIKNCGIVKGKLVASVF